MQCYNTTIEWIDCEILTVAKIVVQSKPVFWAQTLDLYCEFAI